MVFSPVQPTNARGRPSIALGVDVHPMLDALCDEARFEELVAKMHRDVVTVRRRALSRDGSMFRDSLSGT